MPRSLTVNDVGRTLDAHLQPHLAESWDNVGLLVGDRTSPVRRVLVTLDVTRDVLAEARTKRADFILAYHPPIFHAMKTVLADRQAVVFDAIRHNIALYTIHTAYDVIPGGTSDALADVLDLIDRRPMKPHTHADHAKVVVYVPNDAVDRVAEAMFRAGAGHIGHYSHCSFRSQGAGTFCGDATTHPAIGTPGHIERVNETRVETIVRQSQLAEVVSAMRAVHPYEEVAFDVIQLAGIDERIGLGRIGTLPKPMSLRAIIAQVKKRLRLKSMIQFACDEKSMIRTVAVGPGSFGDLAASIAGSVDLFLTGEMRHHGALALREAGTNVLCVGHSHSERHAMKSLTRHVGKWLPTLDVALSTADVERMAIV